MTQVRTYKPERVEKLCFVVLADGKGCNGLSWSRLWEKIALNKLKSKYIF